MSETTGRRQFQHRRADAFSLGSTPAFAFLTIALVALAIVLGGGARQGRWSDAIVQLASLVLVVTLVFQARRLNWRELDRYAIAIVAALLLLPLLQLIRLPPSIWTILPGRETFALAYDEAGIGLPWLPISLDPAATWRSWLGLLPAIAAFFATIGLDWRARRSLSLLIIALGTISVLLGLAQLMQGPASPLRLYLSTGGSVGFFANRNHYAAFLTCLIPLVAAWAVGIIHRPRANRIFGLAVCLIVFVVLILGIAMAASRAGVALALVATIAGFFLIPTGERTLTRYSISVIAAAAAVGVLLAIQFAFFRILGRFEADILADLRFTIAEVTTSAIWTYFPFGTGFGTFEEIYRIFEPRDALLNAYVNHAHNDWLEGLLEGGLPAGLLMVAFLIWFGTRSLAAWRTPAGKGDIVDRTLARAATVAVTLLLLFSLVEFPLRTTTLSVVFAWLSALLIAPLPTVSGRGNSAAENSTRASFHRHPHRRRRPTATRSHPA